MESNLATPVVEPILPDTLDHGEPTAQTMDGQSMLPNWLRRGGSLALSLMVGVVGNALSPELSEADQGYAKPVQPVITHARKKEHHDSGSIIFSVPYGYFIGLAPDKNRIKVTYVTKNKDAAFGAIALNRNGQSITECGWLEQQALSTSTHPVGGPAPCAEERKVLTNRYSFGQALTAHPVSMMAVHPQFT